MDKIWLQILEPFTGKVRQASRSLYMLARWNRKVWLSKICQCGSQTRFQSVLPCWSSHIIGNTFSSFTSISIVVSTKFEEASIFWKHLVGLLLQGWLILDVLCLETYWAQKTPKLIGQTFRRFLVFYINDHDAFS